MTSPAAVVLATRSVGGIEFLRSVLPEPALDALGVLTWLGSVSFVIGLLAVVYWFGVRDHGAFGLAAALGALSLTVALKEVFALPRPPVPEQLIGASGFGFPSGHAIAATVVWGYLAIALAWGSRRQRYAVAGLVVTVVALSRVAVGVHYTVDVVAGVAVGAGYLAVVTRLDGPERAFGLAAGLSLLAVVVTGAGGDALLLLGGSVAGALVWPRLPVPAAPWRREGLLPAVGGGGAIGGLVFVGHRWELVAPLEFVVGAVAVVSMLGLPVLVERIAASE